MLHILNFVWKLKITRCTMINIFETSNCISISCSICKYLEDLSPFQSSNYSLWKATKKTHQQTTHTAAIRIRNGQWARSNIEIANTFWEHLAEVFQPFSKDVFIPPSYELAIMNLNTQITKTSNQEQLLTWSRLTTLSAV